jgi:hypothetical protein
MIVLGEDAANIPCFFIIPKKYREISSNKFSVFFDYLSAMYDELIFVGGGKVYPGD